ncbi:hypothetical protein Hanom_Chr02g00155621 [Helianthus anomalus]
MNLNGRTQSLFIFVCLTYQTKYLVRVCSFIKRTNIYELPTKRFTNCSLNIRFVYSPGFPDMPILLNDQTQT